MKPLHASAAPAVAVLVSLAAASPLACLGNSPSFDFGNAGPDGGAPAHIIYLSQTGDDNNPGTSDQPKRHFDQAIIAAGPDGWVYLSGRYYNERIVITRSGTKGHPVILRPDPNNRGYIDGWPPNSGAWMNDHLVTITGNDLIWDGIEIQNSPWNGLTTTATAQDAAGGDRVTVRNTKVHDIWRQALTSGGDENVFEGCEIYNGSLMNVNDDQNSDAGAGIGSEYSEARQRRSKGLTARGNKVSKIWGSAIGVRLVDGFEISDNDITPTIKSGISVDNAANGTIERNHVHNGGQYAAAFNFGSFKYNNASDGPPHDVTWRNNITHDGGDIAFIQYGDTTFTSYYSLHFVGNTFSGANFTASQSTPPAEGCEFVDNILDGKSFSIADRDIGKWVIDHNDFVGGAVASGTNAHADPPKFVDASVYTPAGMKLSGGSPLIGNGIARDGLGTDFFGANRPNPPSIGAAEP